MCEQQAGPHRSICAKSWLRTIYFGGRAVTQTGDLHPGGPGRDTLPIDYFRSFRCMCELLHPYIDNTKVVGYDARFLGTPVRSVVIGCTPRHGCGPKGGAHLLNSQNVGKPIYGMGIQMSKRVCDFIATCWSLENPATQDPHFLPRSFA